MSRNLIILSLFILALSNSMYAFAEMPESKWIQLTKENEGSTALEICQANGYKTVEKALQCPSAGSNEFIISKAEYNHGNCLEGAKNYSECFKFYSCQFYEDNKEKFTKANPAPGVILASIQCQK